MHHARYSQTLTFTTLLAFVAGLAGLSGGRRTAPADAHAFSGIGAADAFVQDIRREARRGEHA